MGAIETLRDALFGNPPSPTTEPSREGILRAFEDTVQSINTVVGGVFTDDASAVYATRSQLFADLDFANRTLGVVYADPNSDYIGMYIKSGASGSGSWTYTGLLGRGPGASDEQIALAFAEYVAQIEVDVATATTAAERAEAAEASAQAAGGPTYANEAAGLAATSVGESFAVDNGDGTVTIFLHEAGPVATPQRTLPTVAWFGTMATQDADDVDVTGRVTANVLRRPGFYNFKASSFLRWSAALSAHRAGVSRAYIACIGDSTMRGVGSNPSSAVADLVRRSWPSVLADALNQMPNTKATANSIWCDGFFTLIGSGNLAIADPRVSWETGWETHPTMFVAGGKSFLYPSSASGEGRFNFDFTVGSTGPDEDDTVNVHIITAPGNGRILITTNNATEFVVGGDTTGSDGVDVVTGTRSNYFDTAWTVQRSSLDPGTNLQFYGIESFKAADKPIGVWNMGASGSLAASWVDDNQPYSFVNVIQSLAPHLCIICLTINDWAADTAEATYKAQMQEIIDACAVNSDILLVVGVPSNTGTAPVLRQQAFAGYVRDLATTNDLPVLDLSERWVSQTLLPGRGLYYDGLHPTNVGYADVGHLVAQVVGNPGYFFG